MSFEISRDIDSLYLFYREKFQWFMLKHHVICSKFGHVKSERIFYII